MEIIKIVESSFWFARVFVFGDGELIFALPGHSKNRRNAHYEVLQILSIFNLTFSHF
jgi:hypothetical protein